MIILLMIIAMLLIILIIATIIMMIIWLIMVIILLVIIAILIIILLMGMMRFLIIIIFLYLTSLMILENNNNYINTNNNDETGIMNQTDRELIKVTLVFEYKSKSNEIQCSPESKMVKIAKIFSEQNRLNLNRLNFFYKSQKLDLSKTFEEIADENDKMAKKIEIKVKETKNKNNESCFKKIKNYC